MLLENQPMTAPGSAEDSFPAPPILQRRQRKRQVV